MSDSAAPRASSPYMGASVALTTLGNGARTHADSQARLARSSYLEPTVDEVTQGVVVFGGTSFLNLTMIEGPDGLILYDSGEVAQDGEWFLAQVRARSSKPIAAVIYSHSHYVHGTQALLRDSPQALVIGHPRVNANLADGAAGTTYPETAPVQTARLLQQFNHFSPTEGPFAPAGARIQFGKSGMVPVNRPVHNGERLQVGGLELQFFTEHGSDTDDCLAVYVPAKGVVLNNILWPFMPNVYTLRAAKFRDPRDWRDALRVMLDLQPEYLVNSHARAVKGRQAVREALEHVIDALQLVLDQTLRGILRGLGPEELRSFVRLTPELAQHPNLAEIYGEVSHFGPYLFQHALGWFDGDAASINPLPPAEQAQRLVDAMGGAAAVSARARAALQAQEWAWALQLAQYLYRLDPLDPEVRGLKADALLAHARVTPAHTVRSWYVAQARALRGEVDVPRLKFYAPALLALQAPAATMDQFRVRVDPARAGGPQRGLNLRFLDSGACHGWWLRRGVAHFRPEGTPGAPELRVRGNDWNLFFSCRIDADEFLRRTEQAAGSAQAARDFLACFDFYAEADNHLVAPLPSQTI